jgi:hypothetical protein
MKKRWLPNKDLNLDKQFQRLLCYRYTIRQSPDMLLGENNSSSPEKEKD